MSEAEIRLSEIEYELATLRSDRNKLIDKYDVCDVFDDICEIEDLIWELERERFELETGYNMERGDY